MQHDMCIIKSVISCKYKIKYDILESNNLIQIVANIFFTRYQSRFMNETLNGL